MDQVSPLLIVEDDINSDRILRELHEFQRKGMLCDVVLKGKDGIVPAHKLVLMAASQKLYEMLNKSDIYDSDNFSRINEINPAKVVRIIDCLRIPCSVLKDMVTFIYSGKMSLQKSKIQQFSKYCETLGLSVLQDKLLAKRNSRSTRDAKNKTYTLDCPRKLRPKSKKRSKVKSKYLSKDAESNNIKQSNDEIDLGIQNIEGNYISNIKEEYIESEDCHAGHKDTNMSDNFAQDTDAASMTEINIDKHQSYRKHRHENQETEKTEETETIPSQGMIINLSIDKVSISQEPKFDLNDTIRSNNALDDKMEHDDLDNDDDFSQEPLDISISDDDVDTDYTPPVKKVKKTHVKRVKKAPFDRVIRASKRIEINKTKKSLNTSANEFEDDALMCIKCKDIFDTKTALTRHSKTCKAVKPRKRCVLCKISFDTPEEYRLHRKTDRGCLAYRQLSRQRDLDRRDKMRKKYGCRVCSRRFRTVAFCVEHEFMAHELLYDKEKWPEQICEYCSYWCLTPQRLRRHQIFDCSKGQDFICDVCGKKVKNENSLKQHKERQHENGVPMFPCDQCDKVLKGKASLKNHIRIVHQGDKKKPHLCHICSVRYKTNNDLIFHLYRSHDQPLPDDYTTYKCEECNYVINSKGTYEKHKRLHNDSRDFHCEHCSKTFKSQNTLRTHEKMHSEEKKPCPYEGCSYAAFTNTRLKNHIANQHTQKGAKNEECHLCAYSTFFRGNLVKHLRKVHQLEVVTRYNVQMKAKYKNFKSGDIVGPINNGDSAKTMKKSDLKSDRSETITDPIKKREDTNESLSVNTSMIQSNIADLNTEGNLREPVFRASENRFDNQNVVKTSQIDVAQGSASTPSLGAGNAMPDMFGVPSMPISNNLSSLSNVEGLYVPQPVVFGQHDVSMPVVVGGSIREVNHTLPNLFNNKLSAGVPPP